MSQSLTIEDFKRDYQKLVVRHSNLNFRRAAVHKLIDDHYGHMREACAEWLRDKL